jgi:hypothetical protein
MGKIEKIIEKILRGTSDKNISFHDLCQTLHHFGFEERIKGSHHIFFKQGVDEILNLQPKEAKAKPYQVKQVRDVIIKYSFGDDEDE